MKILFSLIFTLICQNTMAEDLLPYHMNSQQGEIHASTSEELFYIDNNPLFLKSTEKGTFEGVFLYKLKPMTEIPYLDLRVKIPKGSLSVQAEQNGRWVELGRISGKTDYQRLKLTLTNGLDAYAKDGVIKIKIISLDKIKFAEVDYIGISKDIPAAKTASNN